MSSCGNPSVETDSLMTRRPKYDKTKACVKCKSSTGNIVIRHAVYCKQCFFPLISIRFRRTLEPHINPSPDSHRRKGLQASGNLFISFSGGLCSTVLLDLVYKTYLAPREQQYGDQNPNRGCPWPRVLVGHVDITGALDQKAEAITDQVARVVKSYGASLEFHPLKLEDAFNKKWWESVGGRESTCHTGVDIIHEDLFLKHLTFEPPSPSSALRAYIAALPTQTAIISAIETLVRVLLLYTAASTNSSHLLLGTSLTSLSISLISSVSKGGGYAIKEESQEEWHSVIRRPQTVRMIRPLRDIGMKECAFWSWWCHLKVLGKIRYSGGRQDITALTREFIVGLERDYPSTVSTIARTCNKLTPKGDTATKCLLCERPAQSGIQHWRNKISIRSYHELDSSNTLPLHINTFAQTLATDNPSLESSDSLASQLCYACHTTWTSRSIRGNISDQLAIPLPMWANSGSTGGGDTGKALAAAEMKEQILRKVVEDFLLDSNS